MISELGIVPPPFFAEACGYRGSARYIAIRWNEAAAELWLSDDGHIHRGRAGAMSALWRREGGREALARYHSELEAAADPLWLLVDRERRSVSLGCALTVWRVIERQHAGEIIRSG